MRTFGPYAAGLCLMVSCGLLSAGTLDSFERAATKPTPPSGHSGDDHDSHTDSCVSDLIGDVFVEAFSVLLYGGVASWERLNPEESRSELGAEPRELGESLIPFIRVDACYESVKSDIDALDYRVEAGYGPVGVHFNQTHLREKAPDDRLDLFRVFGLYRMSLGSLAELDLGFGALTIDGEQTNTKFCFTMPLLINLGNVAGIEVRPAWTETVSDYDVGILLGWRVMSLKAGYRWVASGDEKLDGPYAGLSVRF